MKNVWVQYLPGDCGTFYSWFINQHRGFIANKVPFKLNDPVPNEVIADWNQWNWQDNWGMPALEFHWWWRREHLDKNRDDLKFDILDDDRISFKSYPEHNFVRQPEHTDEVWNTFVDRVSAIPDLAVVQLVTSANHADRFIARMQACFDTYPDDAEDASEMYEWRYDDIEDPDRITDYTRQWDRSVELLPTVPHVQIDAGKLLFDKDADEYNKLIDFLGTEQNPNWKLLLEFYRVQVFDNYGINHVNYSRSTPLGFI